MTSFKNKQDKIIVAEIVFRCKITSLFIYKINSARLYDLNFFVLILNREKSFFNLNYLCSGTLRGLCFSNIYFILLRFIRPLHFSKKLCGTFCIVLAKKAVTNPPGNLLSKNTFILQINTVYRHTYLHRKCVYVVKVNNKSVFRLKYLNAKLFQSRSL